MGENYYNSKTDNINNSEIAKPINNFPDIKELKKKNSEKMKDTKNSLRGRLSEKTKTK